MIDRYKGMVAIAFAPLLQNLADQRQVSSQFSMGSQPWLIVTAGAAVGLAIMLYLADGYHTGFLTLNQLGGMFPASFWASVTLLGDALVALTLLLLIARRHPQLLWAGVLTAILGGLISHSLKQLLDFPRPAAVLEAGAYIAIGPAYKGGSFPSGHTLTAFAFTGLCLTLVSSQVWRSLLLVVATLVGVSRVMVGIHWPMDVCGGVVGGVLAVWLGIRWSRSWSWGISPGGHFSLLGLMLIGNLWLFTHDGGYPDGRWLTLTIATLALATIGYHYCLVPVSRIWRHRSP